VAELLRFGHIPIFFALALYVLEQHTGWPVATGVLVMTVAAMHWWQRQNAFECSKEERRLWEGALALGFVLALQTTIQPRVTPELWLAVSAGLALALAVYGILTRAWLLTAAAQLFAIVSTFESARQHLSGNPGWIVALAPIAVLATLSATASALAKRSNKPALEYPALAYRWVALVLSVWWIHEHIPTRERIWVLIALAVAAFLCGGWWRKSEAFLFSTAFAFCGLCRFWLPLDGEPTVYLPNFLAMPALLATQQWARRRPDDFAALPKAAHNAIIVAGGLSLWIFISRWVMLESGGFYLTVSWSLLALALFSLGLALGERVYRWVGLGILGCAAGRIMAVDIWKLEVIYRVASFAALGVVLLLLGFLYNKYLDKIRQWL
jgi:hypothetical protein